MTSQPKTKGKAIVTGILFWYPLAGVTYQFLHYLIALRQLGWDAYYVEDASELIYDPVLHELSPDATRNVNTVVPILEQHGFKDRWAFRGHYRHGQTFGMSRDQVRQLFRDADVLLNVTGQAVRAEHRACKRLLYIETDPVRTQVLVAQGNKKEIAKLDAHDMHFSYGENLGAPDCGVPIDRFKWHPTRQPVILDFWANGPAPRPVYTTVATWRNPAWKDVVIDGEKYYWSKEPEFLKILDLPSRRPVGFELAMRVDDDVRRLVEGNGWRLADAFEVTRDLDRYREYVQTSRGEFTVAKDQNVRLRSGWFSDRSACYLAAGRPVITQDTGFGAALPTGRGLFPFRTMDDILAAVDAVEGDFAGHSAAARDIAAEYFDAKKVVGSLLDRAGLG